MEFLIVGIAVAFNLLILIWKYQNGRPVDATVDATLLGLVTVVFSGSYGALVVGTVASAIVSIFLLIRPIQFRRSRETV